MMEAHDFLWDNLPKITAWDISSFGAFICMSIDAYCEKHGDDPIEMAQIFADMVREVNEEHGNINV